MAKKAPTDRALATAREILTSCAICECGHLKDEHVMLADSSRCAVSPCRCRQLRAVTFTVERA